MPKILGGACLALERELVRVAVRVGHGSAHAAGAKQTFAARRHGVYLKLPVLLLTHC